MLPPPPRSTLFPYTTLFRSTVLSYPTFQSGGLSLRESREGPESDLVREYVASYLPDRKSTRLNSSHVSISYAVFCLKKKKIYTKRTSPPWLPNSPLNRLQHQ